MLSQDTRSNLVDLADKVEHGVLGQLAESELALADVAGVSLAEDGVTVAGNNTAAVQGVPKVLGDVGVREIVTDLLLHLLKPEEDFLVGPALVVSNGVFVRSN